VDLTSNTSSGIPMNQLIDQQVVIETIRNWEYPQLPFDLAQWPDKSGEDLPDAMRWADAILENPKWCDLKAESLIEFLENWTFVNSSDDVRVPFAYKKGGKMAENQKAVKKLRAVGKDFLYKVGKHVLSGNLNLTTIPFPIRAMVPKSYLEYVGCIPTAFFPLYLNLAVKTTDPVERFKFYMVAQICYFFMTSSFAKPLNPILGETCRGYYEDGSRFYLEQISHHPPISYMLYHGPKDTYKFYGPSQFSASAGLNSITLSTKAWRRIHFKDTDQIIHNTFPDEYYDGTLLGTTVHETIGNMELKDEANGIYCNIAFGKVKKKPSDYIEGTIFVKGEPVSQITGTYLGWLEIDGKRYFDYRYTQPFECKIEKSPLASDFQYRPDKALLALGHYDDAQKEKEQLEHIQRTDAKLRKQYKEEQANRPAPEISTEQSEEQQKQSEDQ